MFWQWEYMIKLILAVDKKGAIGKNNNLLYNIKEDLKNFKDLTYGNIIVMGRNTWDSLPFKPLLNRENVVLSSSDLVFEGAKHINSFKKLKDYIMYQQRDVYIIGGASLYEQFINENLIDEAHITFVEDLCDSADTFVNIEKLEKLLPNKKYIRSFTEGNILANYIVFTR